MRMFAGPTVLMLGVLVMIVGAILQATGAAAVVFCSVIGAGIIVAIVGGAVWLVQAFRHRPTTHPLAS
jgi:hypothetical protein